MHAAGRQEPGHAPYRTCVRIVDLSYRPRQRHLRCRLTCAGAVVDGFRSDRFDLVGRPFISSAWRPSCTSLADLAECSYVTSANLVVDEQTRTVSVFLRRHHRESWCPQRRNELEDLERESRGCASVPGRRRVVRCVGTCRVGSGVGHAGTVARWTALPRSRRGSAAGGTATAPRTRGVT